MPTILFTIAQWHPISANPQPISLSTVLGITICVLLVVAARWGRNNTP